MFSILSIQFSLLLLAALTVIAQTESETTNFHDLIANADPSAIHAALHETIDGKYKHGVFEADRQALEAVHRSSPTEATRIVQLANLKHSSGFKMMKRQSNNTAIVTSTSTSADASIHTSTTILSTRTVTMADGGRSTVTDVTVVIPTDNAPAPVDQPSLTSATATPTKTGTQVLQTGAATAAGVSSVQQVMMGVLAVVGGMAAVL